MVDIPNLANIFSILSAITVLVGVAWCVLMWIIKVCVESLLKKINEELTILNKTMSVWVKDHKLHGEKIERLESKTISHETRIVVLEGKVSSRYI